LNLTLVDRLLVPDIFSIEGLLAELDLEHGHNSGEGEVVEAFFEGLVLIKDGDVGDLVDLVEASNAVLNKLSELDSGLNGVGYTLDDDAVCGVFTEEIVGAFEVSADTDLSLDTDFVRGQFLLGLFDTTIFISHLVKQLLIITP
jgi:hypothetical protein